MIKIRSMSGETTIKFQGNRDGMFSMASTRKTCVAGVISREDAVRLGQALLDWGNEFNKKGEHHGSGASV